MKFKLALLCGLAFAGVNAMACYTVYDGNSRVLYQGADSPVDLSMQLHDALAVRGFPAGSRMQFDRDNCRATPVAMGTRAGSGDLPPNTIRLMRDKPVAKVAQGPLLTEPRTAASMGMPHTLVANNIAMVPAGAAARDTTPAMTVVPATAIARVSTSTAMMGAGPAYDTRTMGAAPSRMPAPSRNLTVITEYRNGDRMVQRY